MRLEKYSLTTIVYYERGKEAYTVENTKKKRIRQALVTKRKAEADLLQLFFWQQVVASKKPEFNAIITSSSFLYFSFYGCTGNPSTIVARCGLVLGGTSTVSYMNNILSKKKQLVQRLQTTFLYSVIGTSTQYNNKCVLTGYLYIVFCITCI